MFRSYSLRLEITVIELRSLIVYLVVVVFDIQFSRFSYILLIKDDFEYSIFELSTQN